MNTPPPTKPPTAGADDPLQQEIQALVHALKAALEKKPDIYRKLCALARTRQVDPEEYRSRLVRAGIAPSHACAFKTLLGSPGHRDAFLQPKGVAGGSTWAQALHDARTAARWELFGLGFGPTADFGPRGTKEQIERAVLAAQVAGRLHRSGHSVCAVAGGTFALTSRVGNLDSLLKGTAA